MSAECELCQRPMPDSAYCCSRCSRAAAELVGGTIGLLRHVDETVNGQATPAKGSHSHAKPRSRPPLDVDAYVTREAVRNDLSGWTRLVCGERGHALPEDSLAAMLQLLSGSVDWLCYRPEGPEAIRSLLADCRQLQWLADRHSRPFGLISWCPCGGELRAREGDTNTVCGDCGTAYTVVAARAYLWELGRDRWVIASDAADILVGWSPDKTALNKRCHDLIRQWAHRGHIEPDEYGRYQFGLIADRWTNALAARVA